MWSELIGNGFFFVKYEIMHYYYNFLLEKKKFFAIWISTGLRYMRPIGTQIWRYPLSKDRHTTALCTAKKQILPGRFPVQPSAANGRERFVTWPKYHVVQRHKNRCLDKSILGEFIEKSLFASEIRSLCLIKWPGPYFI